MSAPAWLTRVSLSRRASARALVQLLLPQKAGDRARSGHNLMWTLFGDSPGSKRDFLWREEGQGRFILLSARPPRDHHQLFEPFEPKPFEPVFAAGDHLRFLLRANATVRRRGDPKPRDVVMDAIYALPKDERAKARRTAEQEASRRWLDAQGAAHGFAVTNMACLGYRTLTLPREQGANIQLGVVDLEGQLTVTDPERFAQKLLSGFGRARAFGCGLMLVARLS
jgi:CRISPR system Cascade subunit CasE